jgi:hypothetical protein
VPHYNPDSADCVVTIRRLLLREEHGAHLRWEQIDLAVGCVRLSAKETKTNDVGLQRDGTPPLQKHSPPAPHWRDVVYLPFFSGFCPGFCPGLSRARYDSPSMTRS